MLDERAVQEPGFCDADGLSDVHLISKRTDTLDKFNQDKKKQTKKVQDGEDRHLVPTFTAAHVSPASYLASIVRDYDTVAKYYFPPERRETISTDRR